MPIDLTKPAEEVDFNDAPYAPVLANLQANILWSHGRDHARHLFIRFTGDPAAVRTWIRNNVAPNVNSAADQRRQKEARAQALDEGRDLDGGLITGFFLSAKGYEFLNLDPDDLPSKGFRKGMKDRSKFDGPLFLKFANRDPEPTEWEPGYQGEIHALLTLADDKVGGSLARLTSKVTAYKNELAAGLGVVTHVEEGHNLKRPVAGHPGRTEPIEHFGYADGISQPYFSKQDLDKYDREQERVREPDDWNPAASLNLVLAKDPFAVSEDAYGSFFVYRKLEQDYAAFQQRVAALAATVEISKELAGAYVVGRFQDGTPINERPSPDPGHVASNHFKHSDDPKGIRCPMHAHTRKSNTRGTTPGMSPRKERAKRITRRAIPYGKPHPDLGCDPAQFEPHADGPRGLLFMCFQASIEKQFEFIQRVWIDNEEFPEGLAAPDTGDDPLIGQHRRAAQKWPDEWNDNNAEKVRFGFEAAVTLKGGEYFFAPSLPFLESL